MLNMPQINSIKDFAREGYSFSEIARRVQVYSKTIRKYLKMQDISPSLEKPATKASILDPYKETIEAWVAADEVEWHNHLAS